MYEKWRPHPKDDNIMNDVYDTPRWRKIAGPPSEHLERIVVQYCVDGATAHNRKQSLSVKAWQFKILNLPPWLRGQSNYMMIQMLIVASLKGSAAKKYYDWAARYEMNDLFHNGVDGVRFLIYGDTLDSPGRRELLNMQAVTAFYPCPHCMHTWEPGLHGQIYGGYRCFLPANSLWRLRQFVFRGNIYMFRAVEEGLTPRVRTDDNVSMMVSLCRGNKAFMGHKGPRFFNLWRAVDWNGNTADVMHDLKCFCECLLKGLVGKNSKGSLYKNWKKDDKHRQYCRLHNMFPKFVEGGDPPWRLSKADIKVLDDRVNIMWWPHYVDKLTLKGHSFWSKSDRMWKSAHKSYVLLGILPTCLRGFVPAVHNAILYIVSALRRLKGQTISLLEAQLRGCEPGSRVIDKRSITTLGIQLIRGLVLLEGSFPDSHLNPALHHLCHYGVQTKRLGILWWLAMWSFERHNKKIKSLIHNGSHTLNSLAKSLRTYLHSKLLGYEERFKERSPGK